MRYLPDINLLLALAHSGHAHHARAARWYMAVRPTAEALHTCAITELGFVRVAVQASLQLDVTEARRALARLKSSSAVPFLLLPDSLGADRLPAFARTPQKLTDGHLLELARAHGAALVTLDARMTTVRPPRDTAS